jgi:biopolymer transport protein ExbB/biopolymer transport protein TolQ
MNAAPERSPRKSTFPEGGWTVLLHQLLNAAESVGAWALYLLIGLSVASVAISLERIVYFAKRRVDAASLGRDLSRFLRTGDVEGARRRLEGVAAVEAEVMLEGLKCLSHGPESVREVIDAALREKKKEYERGLVFLGTLGNNAPFVGLFGTVLGIVSAFKELGAAGASGQMGNVMSGIAEALVATAVGILVAIPAVVAFNYFQKRAGDVEDNVATLVNHVFAEMLRERRDETAPPGVAAGGRPLANLAAKGA